VARFRRFRRFASKKQPLRLVWVTTLFSTSLSVSAANATGQSLLDEEDWTTGVGSIRNPVFVRRIVMSWCYTYDLTGNQTEQQAGLLWVLGPQDVDEQDTSIQSTAAGSILATERVLRVGMNALTGVVNTDLPTLWGRGGWSPVNEVDWKGRLRMDPNMILVMAHQLDASMATSLSGLGVKAISRVLIEKP